MFSECDWWNLPPGACLQSLGGQGYLLPKPRCVTSFFQVCTWLLRKRDLKNEGVTCRHPHPEKRWGLEEQRLIYAFSCVYMWQKEGVLRILKHFGNSHWGKLFFLSPFLRYCDCPVSSPPYGKPKLNASTY